MKAGFLIAICFSVLFSTVLFSQTVATEFTGVINELWSNPDNWTDGLPTAEDQTRFQGGQLCVLDYDAGAVKQIMIQGGEADHLRLVDGARLTVAPSGDGWSIIGYSGHPEEPHLLEVLGGIYTAERRTFVGFRGTGKLVLDYTGVFNQYGQNFGIGQEENGNGRVEVRGGSLNLNNQNLVFRNGANSQASLDFSGGVLTQDFTEARLANILDHITDGTITAYDGNGVVVWDTGDANEYIHVSSVHKFEPFPEDSGFHVPGDVTLQWTVNEGVEVDVWLDTQPDLSTAELVVDRQAVTSVKVEGLEKGTRYFWAVDTYAPNAETSVWGPIFDVYVDNLVPKVTILGGDVTATMKVGSVIVPLTGTVEDVDPTTVLWSVQDEPSAGAAVIADPSQLETTVTLSKLGEYVIQLAADDGDKVGLDTIKITVKSARGR